jgi:hypothetical protein
LTPKSVENRATICTANRFIENITALNIVLELVDALMVANIKRIYGKNRIAKLRVGIVIGILPVKK